MPVTWRSFGCSRRITSTADTLSRSSSGLSVIWMRPLFIVVLTPSAPIKDVRFSTAGSCRITSTSRRCSLDIAAKRDGLRRLRDAEDGARVLDGKKPLGTMMYR